MELSKRKYKKEEVECILASQKSICEEDCAKLRERIEELLKENNKLSLKIEKYKRSEKKALGVLEKAQEKADAIIKSANEKYKLETERLKSFVLRFNAYFKYLFEKYPLYPEIQKANDAFSKLHKLLVDTYGEDVVSSVDGVIEGKKSQLKKVKSTKNIENDKDLDSACGFDINEVLNPGELDLEDLCKELGLLEEE